MKIFACGGLAISFTDRYKVKKRHSRIKNWVEGVNPLLIGKIYTHTLRKGNPTPLWDF